MVPILGWIGWALAAFLAISFTYGCRVYTARGEGFTWAAGVQAMFFWVIAVYFLITPTNKLHIIWLVPVALFSAQAIAISGIPIVTPVVLAVTRAFLTIALLGVKRR